MMPHTTTIFCYFHPIPSPYPPPHPPQHRYHFNINKLMVGIREHVSVWADGSVVRGELERQVGALLGPKTEADMKPKAKEKKKKVFFWGGGGNNNGVVCCVQWYHKSPHAMHHTQCTTHNAPHTMHHTQCTTHNAPHTMHHTQCTTHNAPHTMHHTQITTQEKKPAATPKAVEAKDSNKGGEAEDQTPSNPYAIFTMPAENTMVCFWCVYVCCVWCVWYMFFVCICAS